MRRAIYSLLILALPLLAHASNDWRQNLDDITQIQPSIASTSLSDIKIMLDKHKDTLSPEVINTVLTSIKCIKKSNSEFNTILTIIDYSLPSSQKRLWIFNLKTQQLLFYTYVSHGIKSGTLFTEYFSNKVGSQATSLGIYNTEKPYIGRHGYTLKLNGLENDFNDNADRRAIVLHAAWYVNQDFNKKYGRIGRSWGCPAVPVDLAKNIIDTIKNQSLMVIYYPSQKWIAKSRYLNCENLALQNSITNLKVLPEAPIVDQRGEILYTDANLNNKREENESIVVITADNYIKSFQTQAPLERMLRRQIQGLEYIAINSAELKKLESIKDGFSMLSFVIPEVKMKRGYFGTEFKFVDFGKINSLQIANDTISLSTAKTTINIKQHGSFIRWLGL